MMNKWIGAGNIKQLLQAHGVPLLDAEMAPQKSRRDILL